VVEEEQTPVEEESPEDEAPGRLSAAARRERLGELARQLGDRGALDGDTVVVEVGEPVVLHIELDREGAYTATWWVTVQAEAGHHRWRDVAGELLGEGEEIATSALGGGFLVEVRRETRSADEALAWATDASPVERVHELMRLFPERVAALEPEPIPDFLVPPEPESR
jgi:hypothetical protein